MAIAASFFRDQSPVLSTSLSRCPTPGVTERENGSRDPGNGNISQASTWPSVAPLEESEARFLTVRCYVGDNLTDDIGGAHLLAVLPKHLEAGRD